MTAALLAIDAERPMPPRTNPVGGDEITRTMRALGVGQSFVMPARIKHPYQRITVANRRDAPRRYRIRKIARSFVVWRVA